MLTNGTNMALHGKVFAITGGASGIGLATAKILSRRGATVCIADVDAEAMKEAEGYFASVKASFMITKVDVSQRSQVDSWIDGIVEGCGRLDGAANVAGIIGKYHGVSSVAELDDNEWDKIIAVNLTGMMYCLRAELRKVVDGGSIVNISSIHGLKGESFNLPRYPGGSLTPARIREPRRVRCEQACRDRPHQGSRTRKWCERGPRQRSCPRRNLHASDAEVLGPGGPTCRRAV